MVCTSVILKLLSYSTFDDDMFCNYDDGVCMCILIDKVEGNGLY